MKPFNLSLPGRSPEKPTSSVAPVADVPPLGGTALAALSRCIDLLVVEGDLDLLTESPGARQLLKQLLDSGAPLLPRHGVTLLVAVTPSDGLSAANERAVRVLRSIAPMSAHCTTRLLDLVASSARDAARAALLLALLTPMLLGRDAADGRDGCGLAALSGVHLLLARTLHESAARGHARGVPYTRCVSLPIACVRGATLELAERLMEGLPVEKDDPHESTFSTLGRRGMPLAQVRV